MSDNELWVEDAMMANVGDQYRLFGTDTIFEIAGDLGAYWEATIKSPKGQEIRLQIEKRTLSDAVTIRTLIRFDATTD